MRIVLCYVTRPSHLEQIATVMPEAEIVDASQEQIAAEIFSADIFCGHAKVPLDWDAIVRQGLANILKSEPDIEIVGEASDGVQAVTESARLKPAVIVMDVSMPKMNGVEAAQAIHAAQPEIRIIGLSMYEEADRAEAMRKAGASAYLSKGGPPEALLAAIRAGV